MLRLLFYFGIFHSKSLIMLVLCLVLEKHYFQQSLISVFKMNDTVDFEDNILYILVVYQIIIFHSKSVTLIILCLVLINSSFPIIYTWLFKGKLFCQY